jgi:hypothetical protein
MESNYTELRNNVSYIMSNGYTRKQAISQLRTKANSTLLIILGAGPIISGVGGYSCALMFDKYHLSSKSLSLALGGIVFISQILTYKLNDHITRDINQNISEGRTITYGTIHGRDHPDNEIPIKNPSRNRRSLAQYFEQI